MKKFCKNLCCFFLVLTVVSIVLILFDMTVVGNQYSHGYQASLIDKVERLKTINEPKIILVGNSNVAFGFQSELLEEEMGMPVVNLGLHGALSNAFHEDIAKLNINQGDILVLCHTSFSNDDVIGDRSLAWITLEKHFDLWRILRMEALPEMFAAYPHYAFQAFSLWAQGVGNRTADSCYAREAFNEYGDISFRPESGRSEPAEIFHEVTVSPPEISPDTIRRLNEYTRYVRSCGATLVVAGYPIADGTGTAPESDFNAFQRELESQLDCPVISDYTDYFFPHAYFYDTQYHLTDEGAAMRTKQLIDDLKCWNPSLPNS